MIRGVVHDVLNLSSISSGVTVDLVLCVVRGPPPAGDSG